MLLSSAPGIDVPGYTTNINYLSSPKSQDNRFNNNQAGANFLAYLNQLNLGNAGTMPLNNNRNQPNWGDLNDPIYSSRDWKPTNLRGDDEDYYRAYPIKKQKTEDDGRFEFVSPVP
jgi:hypothetical protein